MASSRVRLTDAQLEVARFCAIECELQQSGERSVFHMLVAWTEAQRLAPSCLPTEDDVRNLAFLVEPKVNAKGYRQVGVRVGFDIKMPWQQVARRMETLAAAVDDLTPEEWFRSFEECHPFRDGNGRTGQILYNWLRGTLDAPQWAPNFWRDHRRLAGCGAPGVAA